jgi:hypothetical protein
MVPRLESRRRRNLRQVLQPEGGSLLHFGARYISLASEILVKEPLPPPKKIGTAGKVVHNLREQSQVRLAIATGSQAICYRRRREISRHLLATGT